MRKSFSFFLISVLILLVSGCSLFLHSDDSKDPGNGQKHNDPNNRNNNKIPAADVLDKSIRTMSQWKGFDITYVGNEEQKIINQTTGQSVTGHHSINNRIQFLNANLFHLTVNIHSLLQDDHQRKRRGERVQDIYVEGNMLYYKDQNSNIWKQTQVSQETIFNVLGANPRYIQPVYFLEKMKQQESKVLIEENDSEYIISISLSNSSEIKQMMDSFMDQAYKNPHIDVNGIRFYSYYMTFWIDKQSFQLKKSEHHSKVEFPTKQKVLIQLEHKTTQYINGEVKQITIPQEVHNRL